MKDSAMVVSGFSADIKILNAIGVAGSGIISTSQWNHDLDNAANQQFLLGFRSKFEREPTLYASQGYDTAKLIASALKATGGKVLEDKAGFREALKAAKFASVRGIFDLLPISIQSTISTFVKLSKTMVRCKTVFYEK